MLQNISQKLKTEGKYRIVFTGDSITSCEWVHPNWREIVEYVLKQKLTEMLDDWKLVSWGIRAYNCAFDGATIRDIVEKFENEILLVKPDLLICIIGVNDIYCDLGISGHGEYVVKLIEKCRKNKVELVFCTSIPAGGKILKMEKYPAYVEKDIEILAKNKEVVFVNLFEKYQQFDLKKFFTFKSEEIEVAGIKEGDPDYWHPNQLGNAYLAKLVLEEAFSVEFDPEKYIGDTLKGEKYPGY